MTQFFRMLMTGVVVLATGASVSTQSLADAARRAEEQRQQASPDTPAFTDRDLNPGGLAGDNRDAKNLVLTMPLIQQYVGARAAISRALAQSPDLDRQMRALINAGRQGVDGLEQAYAAIPAVVEGLRSTRMTVHDFVVTEVAFMGAVGVLAGRLPMPAASAGTLSSNVEFLKQHQPELAALLKAPLPNEPPK
jgi:hypothetical protein